MNNAYDWKTHYDLPLTMCEGDGSFHLYYFDDDKTAGKVMSCSILPGVQMIYNDLNVADIAAAVGYSNPAKFASAFKSETGLTPKEYKNSAALDS